MIPVISKELVSDPIAIVSNVREGDNVFVAAQKAIDTMKLAGFSARSIKKAEKTLADAKHQYFLKTGERA